MVVKRPFEYKDSEGNLFEGVLAHPKDASSKSLPGVLIIHAFGGCGKFEEEKAEELAKNGYVALAADVYGKGKRGTTREENFALMKPLVDERNGVLKNRLNASLEALKSVECVNSEQIVAIGYCFGGLCVLDMARHGAPVKGVVSFHGNLSPLPDVENTPVSASILIHHGDADFHIPEAQVLAVWKEFRDRKADFVFVSHANAEHAFTEPHASALGIPGVSYNEKADKRSWASMLNFLSEKLH